MGQVCGIKKNSKISSPMKIRNNSKIIQIKNLEINKIKENTIKNLLEIKEDNKSEYIIQSKTIESEFFKHLYKAKVDVVQAFTENETPIKIKRKSFDKIYHPQFKIPAETCYNSMISPSKLSYFQ